MTKDESQDATHDRQETAGPKPAVAPGVGSISALLATLLNPVVFAAIVTTVLGSLAVGLTTNFVTKSLGERELQFKAVEALVAFISTADIEDENNIRKLSALTTLIQDQQEIGVQLNGFREIVDNFREDKIAEVASERDAAGVRVGEIEAEKRDLETRLQDASNSSAQERDALKDQLLLKESELAETKLLEAAKNAELTARKAEQERAETALGTATEQVEQLEASLRDTRRQLSDATSRPEQVHAVTFEFHTATGQLGGATNDSISVVFSDEPGDTTGAVDGAANIDEFTFPGRGNTSPGMSVSFARRVRDLRFLSARYVRVINPGRDGWAGGWLSISVDGQRVFHEEPLYPRKGRQEQGGIEKFNREDLDDANYWEAQMPLHPSAIAESVSET